MSQIDETTQKLYQPLLDAMGKEHATEFWSILRDEAPGVLAWGVRSGYLLWTRTHPGVTPTREQVREWMRQAKQ